MHVRYLWFIVALSLAVFAGWRFLGHATGVAHGPLPSGASTPAEPVDWVAVSAAVSAVIAAIEALTRAVSSLVALIWKRKNETPDTPTQAGA